MLFWAARNFMAFMLRVFFRVTITGAENIPDTGAFIICANHMHTLDPAVVAMSLRRRIYFIGKKELYDNRFKRPFLEPLGVITVNRNAVDTKAYKYAIEILNGGNGLLVFSQGTRMKEFTEFKRGAALFALKTGTCIVPVGISGSYKLFSALSVQIGEPVSMAPYLGQKIKSDLVDEVMERVVSHVKRLAS
jgi:1-acyl-sn-glycerol-3-phosphate acyltransferase